jgi:protein required for attachment to host cells
MAEKRTPMRKINVERRNHAWFALADAEHCRLLSCRLTKQGTQHVEELGALENTLPEAEHARPMTQDGTTHDIEEEERRFAAQIVTWLQEKAKKHEIPHLVILAPSRMLGVLRKVSSGSLTGHLEELRGDLMRLDAGQSADHPMVRQLMPTTHQR